MSSSTASKLIEQNIQIYLEVQNAFNECDEDIREIVKSMLDVCLDKQSTEGEKRLAMHTIVDALFPSASVDVLERERAKAAEPESKARELEMDAEQASFAEKVSEIMESRGLTQLALAELVGVTQPAISNILSRNCRPQDRTVERIAEALDVAPETLWPRLQR